MKITNITKALKEISQLISQDKNIVQLLYNDEADALENPITIPGGLDFLINEDYITFYPPVDSIKDKTRNTFLVVLLDSINLTSDNLRGSITIYVTTDIHHVLLTQNRNRLLELSDNITQLLDHYKLSSAGELVLTNISHVMLNEFRAGYRISMNIVDQNTDTVWL